MVPTDKSSDVLHIQGIFAEMPYSVVHYYYVQYVANSNLSLAESHYQYN